MPHLGPDLTYLQMITIAISHLKERTGSSEDAIAKFIEQHYEGGTPKHFRRTLKSMLEKHVKSEQLVKINNSYKIKKKEKKKGKEKSNTVRAERSATDIMGDLKKIQKELDEVEEDKRELRRSIYDRRSEIIKEIPYFWLNAFLSHFALGDILNEEDHKIFRYLESVNVEGTKPKLQTLDSINGEETEDPVLVYTITLDFNEQNPYFENPTLRKTFSNCVEEMDTKGCTIKWKDNFGNVRGHPGDRCGFFTWFSGLGDVSEGNLDEVAELIIEDLWPNAIKYFINGNRDYEEECYLIEEINLWAACN